MKSAAIPLLLLGIIVVQAINGCSRHNQYMLLKQRQALILQRLDELNAKTKRMDFAWTSEKR